MCISALCRIAVFSLMVIAGCSSLRLGDALGISTTPLILAKAAPHPIVLPACRVVPPLTQEWEGDVSAGVAQDPPAILDSVILIGNLRGELHALQLRTGKSLGSVTLGNAITGSPVIWGTVAYVGLAGSKESLIAYDFLFGTVVWKQSVGDVVRTPALIDGKLYVGNTAGTFSCVECETGRVVWRFELPDNTTVKGIRSSAAGDSTRIIFGADDGGVYALNPHNGIQLWRYQMDAAIQAPIVKDSTKVFVSTIQGTIATLDAQTGTLLWSYELASPVYAPIRIAADKAIVCATSGAVVALHLASGTVAWKYIASGPINAGPLVMGYYLLVGTLKKELLALDMSTGTVVWTATLNGRIKTAPAATQDKIIVTTDEPMIVCYRGSTP